MKKAICLILLVMILGAGALPSFAQYRKPVSEMSGQELQALIREKRDKFEMYTRRTRAVLSSFIGQDISLGKDGFALLSRYYPVTIAGIRERLNQVLSEPMYMPKSTKEGTSPGDAIDIVREAGSLIQDAGTALWTMITFADEIIENHIEQDLFNVFRDREEYPDERIEAMAEMISDLAAQDAADAARAIGDSSGQGQTAWYIAGALYDLYAFLEAGVEHERRKALREYFWPGGPQPGPARGAPTGQPGPQGWIIGRPGGNGSSRGGEVVTVTGGGCVTISYDQNNNPIITIAPCK